MGNRGRLLCAVARIREPFILLMRIQADDDEKDSKSGCGSEKGAALCKQIVDDFERLL